MPARTPQRRVQQGERSPHETHIPYARRCRAGAGPRGRAGRARRLGAPEHHLLAGALDAEPVPVGRHEGNRIRLARARIDGPLRQNRRRWCPGWRNHPDRRERRHLRGPDLDHLDHRGGHHVVGRHAADAPRTSLHLRILHPSRRRLRAGQLLRRRGASRPDDNQCRELRRSRRRSPTPPSSAPRAR
jgi:hypothetical protein